jgi:hypothetical protein
MPVAAAIHWTPVGQVGADPVSPIFITQTALAAVHAEVAVQPKDVWSLGFFVGGVYLSPGTRIPYIIVESTIHICWSIADQLKAAVLDGYALAQEEATRIGKEVLGWYHGYGAGPARLSGTALEAHVACFDQPWQIALVVSRGSELTGGVFRTGSEVARANDDGLPFYEVPEDDPVLPGGRRVEPAEWANYAKRGIAFAPPSEAVPPPAVASGPHLIFPDDIDRGLPRRPSGARQKLFRAPGARVVNFAALGMVVAGALFGAYRAVASGVPEDPVGGVHPGSAAPTPSDIARLGDTVSFAVAAFDLRARLFAGHKMGCADLARGLVDLEQRWTAYSAARGLAAGTPDSARIASDPQLLADVGVVEQRFARTGCPRP